MSAVARISRQGSRRYGSIGSTPSLGARRLPGLGNVVSTFIPPGECLDLPPRSLTLDLSYRSLAIDLPARPLTLDLPVR